MIRHGSAGVSRAIIHLFLEYHRLGFEQEFKEEDNGFREYLRFAQAGKKY